MKLTVEKVYKQIIAITLSMIFVVYVLIKKSKLIPEFSTIEFC